MSFRRFLKSITWKLMPFAEISFTANTGISFPVTKKIERDIIRELFFNKEYEALFSSMDFDAVATVLDLGCNVGFFSLYMEHYLRLHLGKAGATRYLMIDANKECIDLAQRNVEKSGMSDLCRVVEGLVGKRGAVKDFHVSKQLGRSSSVVGHEVSKTLSIKSLDLEDVSHQLGFEGFDLIKADIEGAEGELIEEYGALIASARYLLFEWHATCGLSWEEFVGKLSSLGFSHVKTNQEYETSRTTLFERS
jgi:FkbM family methyltransferase